MYSTVVNWHIHIGQSIVGTLNQCLIPIIEMPLMGLKKSLHTHYKSQQRKFLWK